MTQVEIVNTRLLGKDIPLHPQGMSFCEIERQTGVSHNTVINWVRQSNVMSND